MDMSPPVVTIHDGISVIRDDLYPGGTKARYVGAVFEQHPVAVYASPCEGGAQVALAHAARAHGATIIIVCAKRLLRHPRTIEAMHLGAELVEIEHFAMFPVVQARARDLAALKGWHLIPFGLDLPSAVPTIRDAALATGLMPDEVWSVASSGVLARGLAAAWPLARRHVVQVGHKVTMLDVEGATIHPSTYKFRTAVENHDFPSDSHYEAKAWKVCRDQHGPGQVVFWNVMGR